MSHSHRYEYIYGEINLIIGAPVTMLSLPRELISLVAPSPIEFDTLRCTCSALAALRDHFEYTFGALKVTRHGFLISPAMYPCAIVTSPCATYVQYNTPREMYFECTEYGAKTAATQEFADQRGISSAATIECYSGARLVYMSGDIGAIERVQRVMGVHSARFTARKIPVAVCDSGAVVGVIKTRV